MYSFSNPRNSATIDTRLQWWLTVALVLQYSANADYLDYHIHFWHMELQQHKVQVHFTNLHMVSQCDRNCATQEQGCKISHTQKPKQVFK
jgi:hypothetical protein